MTQLRATAPSCPGSQRPEDRDHIRMLEAQVQIFTEDFQHERKDRERVQSRCTELESELNRVKRQLEQFQATYMNRAYNQRAAAMASYQNGYHNHRNIHAMAPQHQPMPREIESDGHGEDKGEDCLDSGDMPSAAMAVRELVRTPVVLGDGSTADSNVPPPAFLPKNAVSSHPQSSLFLESTMGNKTGQSTGDATCLLANVSCRTGSQVQNLELGCPDVF